LNNSLAEIHRKNISCYRSGGKTTCVTYFAFVGSFRRCLEFSQVKPLLQNPPKMTQTFLRISVRCQSHDADEHPEHSRVDSNGDPAM
jgi:hypothetical protein